ncbi:hypothetical protein GUJ93_ZPchr0070g33437 [Zizania palustris]|uniref:Uncharacterized protein n=1 Tax=Zizania palustris TaxID=103762 RepID=A0A8J5VES4_ZIZPA|nr:hypothetical protein GUJ93_ZPchr0070g33437 [Zizania palustris]
MGGLPSKPVEIGRKDKQTSWYTPERRQDGRASGGWRGEKRESEGDGGKPSHLDACLPASLLPHRSFALLCSFPFFTASLRSNAHPLYKGELHTAASSSSVSLSSNPKNPSFSFVVDPAISR